MFLIHKSQLTAFNRLGIENFKDRALRYIGNNFPLQLDLCGDARIREIIDYGIARAARYGLRTERQVLTFLVLILKLGGCFDSDFLLPWARDILLDVKVESPDVRVRDLCFSALEYLGCVGSVEGGVLEGVIPSYS
jgi:hypothetical protein